MVKPAVGGLLVGLLGTTLLIPQVLSSGYGWVQLATTRESLLTIPLWIVLVLPVAKISPRRCRSGPEVRAASSALAS